MTQHPSPSILEHERADHIQGQIEKAEDHVKQAIELLQGARHLARNGLARSCQIAAEELAAILRDEITGGALHEAKEAANTARLAYDASYPQDDVAGWLAAASRHAAE